MNSGLNLKKFDPLTTVEQNLQKRTKKTIFRSIKNVEVSDKFTSVDIVSHFDAIHCDFHVESEVLSGMKQQKSTTILRFYIQL